MEETNKPQSERHKNAFYKNLSPDQYRLKLKNEEMILNYNKRLKEYRTAAIFEDLSDLFNYNYKKPDFEEIQSGEKRYLEEALFIGKDNEIPNRGFIQIDVGKQRRLKDSPNGKDPYENKTDDDILLEDAFNYFQKLLVFKIGDNLYSTGSFCSYDLTNLREGILLGDKLICPTCMSEFCVKDGTIESGPASKNLASFPVNNRNEKIFVRIPLEKIPVFSEPTYAEYNNELDPRHVVLIGDTETIAAAVNTLRLFFTGKISIITNKGDCQFIDRNKLTKSMFPVKAKDAKFFDFKDLDKMGITVYDEKVNYIDGNKRIIALKNKMKIPFDKVLISTGSTREILAKEYDNLFTLQTINDHAEIHNAIIKEHVKSIVIMGTNLKCLEIASSLRRYLDALGHEDVNVSIVSDEMNVIEQHCGPEAFKMIQDYLKRNRIFIFRGQQVEIEEQVDENEDDLGNPVKKESIIKKFQKKHVKNLVIGGEKYVFRLPADVIIYENGLHFSKCDFSNKILVNKDLNHRIPTEFPNIFIPDERLSLNEGVRYPYIFAAGDCSLITAPALYDSKLRSDNMRTNYQLGYFSTISMFEFHYPFDDVVVDNCKILDKNLFYIGTEPYLPGKTVVKYVNKEKSQFVIYNYDDDKLLGCFVYGFKNLHMFIREAIRYKFIPGISYAEKHKDTLHRNIAETVLKKTDVIKCMRNFTLNRLNNISTMNYTIEDQEYTEDLMKRGLIAYNEMTEKYKEEDLKFQEELDKKKAIEQHVHKKIKEKNNSEYQE